MEQVNLLLPVAGLGQRFIDDGYIMPKPLLMVHDRHLIDWALDSIDYSNCNLIFVVRDDHIYNFSIDEILLSKFGSDTKIVRTDGLTDGAVSTCLLAEEYIDNELPLVIYTPDVHFQNQFDPLGVDKGLDGYLLTFKSNSPAHSYAQVGETGQVVKTAEKLVISSHAVVGVYYFKHGHVFVKHAEEMIKRNIRTKNEFYICPVYNLLIEDKKRIEIEEVEKMHVLGTPEDLRFFTGNALKRFGESSVALCADHSGYHLKEEAKSVLQQLGIRVVDCGTYTDRDCDYFDYITSSARAILEGNCDFGLGFCRTGQGMNMAANKIDGLRAALVFDEYMAEYAIRHNCANFFSVPSKYIDAVGVDRIIQALQSSSFDGGRHKIRVEKLSQRMSI